MLADVPNESEEEIKKRLSVYESRFINRYTEKDDGYKICVQKAARHNQVPVIDYDKRQLQFRRKGWRDRRMTSGKRDWHPYHHRGPRYNNDEQGPSPRKEHDHMYSGVEEVSSLSHPNRNTLHQLQAPRTPSPSHSNQLPPLDIAACGQPLALHDDYTRPQTPGAPDSKNAPSPLEEEKNFMGSVTDKGPDQSYNFPDQVKPKFMADMDMEPEQGVPRPKQMPIMDDFPVLHQAPTEEDAKMILADVSKTKGLPHPLEKGKKTQKKVLEHAAVKAKDKGTSVPQSIHPPLIPAAQMLKSPHLTSSGHGLVQRSHQPSTPSSVGMLVTHGTPQRVQTSFIAGLGDEVEIGRVGSKKDKKKRKRKRKSEERIDESGEESNLTIDVTTVDGSNPGFECSSMPYISLANPSATPSPIVIHLPLRSKPCQEDLSAVSHPKKKKKKHSKHKKSDCPSD